jgi:hypothetical protein
MLARLGDRVPLCVGGQEKDDVRVGTVYGTVRAVWGHESSPASRWGSRYSRPHLLDGGQPMAVYTVSPELGHSSTSMVEAVYSHLGDGHVRQRCEEWSSASSSTRVSWASARRHCGQAPATVFGLARR